MGNNNQSRASVRPDPKNSILLNNVPPRQIPIRPISYPNNQLYSPYNYQLVYPYLGAPQMNGTMATFPVLSPIAPYHTNQALVIDVRPAPANFAQPANQPFYPAYQPQQQLPQQNVAWQQPQQAFQQQFVPQVPSVPKYREYVIPIPQNHQVYAPQPVQQYQQQPQQYQYAQAPQPQQPVYQQAYQQYQQQPQYTYPQPQPQQQAYQQVYQAPMAPCYHPQQAAPNYTYQPQPQYNYSPPPPPPPQPLPQPQPQPQPTQLPPNNQLFRQIRPVPLPQSTYSTQPIYSTQSFQQNPIYARLNQPQQPTSSTGLPTHAIRQF